MDGQGSVSVTEKGPAVLRTDGPCLGGTLASLGVGAKPMPPAALDKIKADALTLLGRVVSVYESAVAQGEVGATGTGAASNSVPTQPSTGLLYGRIQSGKTVAMIALVAAAIDNGFRVVVVLTSDNVKLVSQTTGRFAALEGPITLDARQPDEWSGDDKHIAKNIGKAGLVIVCSKNSTRLEDLVAFLKKVGAPGYAHTSKTMYVTRYAVLDEPEWYASKDIPTIRVADAGVSSVRYRVDLDGDHVAEREAASGLWKHFWGQDYDRAAP